MGARNVNFVAYDSETRRPTLGIASCTLFMLEAFRSFQACSTLQATDLASAAISVGRRLGWSSKFKRTYTVHVHDF